MKLTAERVIDQYFLETRCALLEIAATLDRYDAARDQEGGSVRTADQRLEKLYQSLALLADRSAPSDRTERLLHLFSDPAD